MIAMSRDDHDMRVFGHLDQQIDRRVSQVHVAVLQRSSLGSRTSRQMTARGWACEAGQVVADSAPSTRIGVASARSRSFTSQAPGSSYDPEWDAGGQVQHRVNVTDCLLDGNTRKREENAVECGLIVIPTLGQHHRTSVEW